MAGAVYRDSFRQLLTLWPRQRNLFFDFALWHPTYTALSPNKKQLKKKYKKIQENKCH
jgi:hypothetical protein